MSLRSDLFATGIRRTGGPRNGFRFRRANGKRIATADAQRIAALGIPRTWTDVRIAASPRERLQAIGRDPAGRWQYLYRPSHVAARSRVQFDRLIAFGEALPVLRRALARDLARPGLSRDKAMACAVALLTTCWLRPGTEIHTKANGSFGLATLRHRHVAVDGTSIRLDFRGKHGQRQRHVVENGRLARIVAAMQRLPGDEVFKFREPGGAVRDLRSNHLNAYIKQALGEPWNARTFRTWGGTLLCAGALARAARHSPATEERTPHGARLRHAAVAGAVRETAARLGNTVAACRRAYIHPGVLGAFANGRVVSAVLSQPEDLIAARAGLDRSERALLALLRGERAARAD